jgi:hypothetical protein
LIHGDRSSFIPHIIPAKRCFVLINKDGAEVNGAL